MDSTRQNFKYYVLRTVTGKEKDVEEYINSMRDIEPVFRNNVRDILIPMETTLQTNKFAKSGKVERTRPYYSGYVFVEALMQGETAHKLRTVPCVLGFLGGETDPIPLSDRDVEQLRKTSDRLKESPSETEITFNVGERVKMTYGPFSGFFGEIVEVLYERRKLKILVKVFGRETLMDVDYSQVEKVDALEEEESI